jgi:hypothetical protein
MSTLRKDSIGLFRNNELVWGKVSGYPWWPGLVTSIEDEEHGIYHVDFFGYPSTHALLSHSKIIRYGENGKSQDGNRISPQLKRAINEANLLFTALEESKVANIPP